MKSHIKGRVFWVGSIVWNDNVQEAGLHHHFHKSSSYNSYLIASDHNILVDTVSEEYATRFIHNLETEISISDLYGIVLTCDKNDHTGAVAEIIKRNPGVKIFISPYYLKSIGSRLGNKAEIIPVDSGDSIEEGDLAIDFIDAVPFGQRHSLFSYLRKEKILFSGYATEYVIQDILGNATGNNSRTESVHRRLQRSIGEKIGMKIEPDIICTNHGTPMFVV